MKTRLLLLSLVAPLVIARFAECHAQQLWMSGYITSWCLNMTGIPGGAGAANYGTQPYDKIDLDAMTHLIAFAAGPDSMGNMDVTTEWDGSNTWGGSLLLKRRKPFNDYVHAHGKAILCCFFSRGGGGDWTKIMGSSARRRTCIRTIIDSIIVAEHYDGVDFDLEPVGTGDTAATRSFIAELRDSLNLYHAWYDASKKPLITAATYTYPDFWARCAPSMDQVNIMTYDMFGTWCTRVWHNCPVYAGPDGKDIYGNMLTSVQNKTQSWINAGVPRNKVGLGIGMNGHIWKGGLLANGNGITAPLQQWVTAPTEPSGETVVAPQWKYWREYEACRNTRRPGELTELASGGLLGSVTIGFADPHELPAVDEGSTRLLETP